MITNYLIYLNILSKEKRIELILIMLAFFLILLTVCFLLELTKLKFIDKNKINKNSSFKNINKS